MPAIAERPRAAVKSTHGGHNKIEKDQQGDSPLFVVKLGPTRHAKLMEAAKKRGLPASELIRRAVDALYT